MSPYTISNIFNTLLTGLKINSRFLIPNHTVNNFQAIRIRVRPEQNIKQLPAVNYVKK